MTTTGSLPDLRQFVVELQGQGTSIAMQCADALRSYAPVGKGSEEREAGTFAASLAGRAEVVNDGLIITVESDDEPVAGIIIGGSGAHEIVVRNAGSLRWESSGGELRFAKRVWHPGTAPNDFPTKAEFDIELIVAAAVSIAERAL